MITITAASGKLGRATAEALAKVTDPRGVRLAARTPAKLDDLSRRGFQVVPASYDDAASVQAALADTHTLMLISSEGPNELRIEHHKTAIDAAQRSGVKRVVYTSFTNSVPQSRFLWAPAHGATEDLLRQSHLAWTILRDNQYASGLDNQLRAAIQTGVLALAGATGKVAYVLHEDIAAAAAAVLIGNDQENRLYELTGPEALDGFEVAAALSLVLDREIAAVDATDEQVAAHLRAASVPEFVVAGLISLYRASAAGEYATVSNDMQQLIGRKARSMREYIAGFVRVGERA